MKVLVVVDMQNDFINGALGSAEAQMIVKNVVEKIKNFDGVIVTTKDTHYVDYMNTLEGQKLPVPHCIVDTQGWELHPDIKDALAERYKDDSYIYSYHKSTFGAINLDREIKYWVKDQFHEEIESIELCGLCTDICVISNALILRAHNPNTPMYVDQNCCAGTTPHANECALEVMNSCQIEVI